MEGWNGMSILSNWGVGDGGLTARHTDRQTGRRAWRADCVFTRYNRIVENLLKNEKSNEENGKVVREEEWGAAMEFLTRYAAYMCIVLHVRFFTF